MILTVEILVLEAAGAAARLGWMKPPGEKDITQAPAAPPWEFLDVQHLQHEAASSRY